MAEDNSMQYPRLIGIRDRLVPGDVGAIVRMHGLIYAREHGFDETFEAYVAGPLADCVLARRDRDRIWIAEDREGIVGSIAMVQADERTGQLRWFLVDPRARRGGMGRRMLASALRFARAANYERVVLWTVAGLEAAARLYRETGFEKVETKPGRMWGVSVVEERYELRL